MTSNKKTPDTDAMRSILEELAEYGTLRISNAEDRKRAAKKLEELGYRAYLLLNPAFPDR